MKKIIISILLATILCSCEDDKRVPQETEKNDSRTVLDKSVATSKELFKDVEKGANEISKEISNIPVKKMWNESADAVAEGAEEVGEGIKKAGEEVGSFFKGLKKKISE